MQPHRSRSDHLKYRNGNGVIILANMDLTVVNLDKTAPDLVCVHRIFRLWCLFRFVIINHLIIILEKKTILNLSCFPHSLLLSFYQFRWPENLYIFHLQLTNLFHELGSFFRGPWTFSWTRSFPPFVEPEVYYRVHKKSSFFWATCIHSVSHILFL
jgi:hypothetical protein